MKKTLLLGLVICTFFRVQSQSFFELSFEHLDRDDGIEGTHCYFINKDHDKFTWIGSLRGVYRFDGKDVEHFLLTGNGQQKRGNNIQSNFLSDSEKNTWFATLESIYCYQKNKNRLKPIQLHDSYGEIITGSYTLFHLERDSVLWVRADKYIIRYNIYSEEQNIIDETQGTRFAVDTLKNGKIHKIFACPWINNPGIEVFTIGEGKLMDKTTLFEEGMPDIEAEMVTFKGAIIDDKKNIWYFTDQGLLSSHVDCPEEIIVHNMINNQGIDIYDGALYKNTHLFLGTKNNGLLIFDTHNRRYVQKYNKSDKSPDSLRSNSIRGVYIDEEQHIWISNNSTLVSYTWLENGQNKFENPFSSSKGGFPTVSAIIEDNKDQIWCTTTNEGVHIFNRNGTHQKHYSYNEIYKKGEIPKEILKLRIDHNGEIWGLSHSHILKYDNIRHRWMTKYKSKNRILYDFQHISRSSLVVSSNDGVFKMQQSAVNKELRIDRTLMSNGASDIIDFYKINNKLVFPNSDLELLIYKYENDSIFYYNRLPLLSEVYTILEDSINSEFFVGTMNGLVKVNEAEDTLSYVFQSGDLLHNIKITNINKDLEDNLWLTTDIGLFCHSIHKDYTFQFRKEDGLTSENLIIDANRTTRTGEIWVGANDGLLKFDPDSINPYPHSSSVYIQSIKTNGNLLQSDHDFFTTDFLSLPYNQNDIEFSVKGISYYLNKYLKIYYKLGAKGEWSEIEDPRHFQLNKLSPGKYKLYLRSYNANGIKGEIRKIEVQILPPFWRNPKYVIPIILSLGLIIILAIKWLLSVKLQRQKELLEALQEERNRIAGEMHDDLGGELYSIRFLTQKIENSDELQSTKKLLESKAEGLVENMREIVWALDSNNDSLSELVSYIRIYFIEFFAEHDINANAQILEHIPDVRLSAKQRRNIFLCVKEALHNIGKHANATKVDLSFKMNKALFFMIIKDNGSGVRKSNKSEGKGLNNMNNRMQAIGGKFELKNTNGTIVTFSFPINVKKKFFK